MSTESRTASIRWFSGTGKGGQHRNKHENCCEITDPVTGLSAIAQSSRSREQNKREACASLKRKLVAYYAREKAREHSATVVRTLHMERNVATDHRAGDTQLPKDVLDGDLIVTTQESTTQSGRV